MYLAYLLKSRGFFRRTSNWMDAEGMAVDITFLLSRATSAIVNILRIEQAQNLCLMEYGMFEEQLGNMDEKIVFNSRSLVELQNEISPLLSSLRIMQDLTIRLIGKSLRVSVPASINKAVNNINRYKFPKDIKELLINYWDSGGSIVRDYRILDQHYSNITDYIFLEPKQRKILLFFPDDPATKSRKKFTYENEICGISLLRIGFDDLHELIENLAKFFGHMPGEVQNQTLLHQLGDLRPYRNRVLSLVYESPITNQSDGTGKQNISAIKFSQTDEGTIMVQKLLVSKEKLKMLNKNIK